MGEHLHVGGQAVVEGVLMLSKEKTAAVAVRNPKGKIVVKTSTNRNKFMCFRLF